MRLWGVTLVFPEPHKSLARTHRPRWAREGMVTLLADEVRIALLLVGEGLKVLFDLESDDTGWRVSQVVRELLGVHCEKSLPAGFCGRKGEGRCRSGGPQRGMKRRRGSSQSGQPLEGGNG